MDRIDRLTPGEGPRLRAIRLRSLADAPDAFATTLAQSEAQPENSWEQAIASLPTFVAVQGGADVGIVRGAEDPDDAASLYLISMWVAPEARGRGVGGSLIDALVELAHERGFERILLDVGDDQRAGDRALRSEGLRADRRPRLLARAARARHRAPACARPRPALTRASRGELRAKGPFVRISWCSSHGRTKTRSHHTGRPYSCYSVLLVS